MLGADGEFLAEVAALAEVDAVEVVEVRFLREGGGGYYLRGSFGDAVEVAVEFVALEVFR